MVHFFPKVKVPFKVEIERFDRISLQDRLECELCSVNAVEDKEHFMTQCNMYDNHDFKADLYTGNNSWH